MSVRSEDLPPGAPRRRHQIRSYYDLKVLRRLPLFRPLSGLVVAVGVAGGIVGAAYVALLRGLEQLIGPSGHTDFVVITTLVASGAAIALLMRVLGDPGDVELLVDNIHVNGGKADVRSLRSLVPVSLLGIAAGSALGPEAPLVQTAGTTGTLVGVRFGQDSARTRILTLTGMASAFAVLFGAPLGSAIFALEILHRRGLEYYEALIPVLGGALIGFAVYLGLEGSGFGPVFDLPEARVGAATDLGWAAVAAVAGVAIAIGFTYTVRGMRRVVGHVPILLRPAFGGLAIGLLSVWSLGALTFGEEQIAGLHELGAAALIAALTTKFLASAACLSTGWRGGFIIPLFFCGAAAGLLLHHLLPDVDASMLMAAAMVAANAGVTKTPLGSTLVVTEMGGLHLLPTTTLAAVIAIALTSEIHLIASQRSRPRTHD